MATPLEQQLMQTGGNQPATPVAPAAAPNYSALSPFGATAPSPFAGRDYNAMVSSSLEHFLDPNSDYIRNARRRGMEYAQQRGGINSSIAAGAAERSAMEAATPLAQGAVAAQLGQEQAVLQDWMNTQGFNRELAAMPYQSSMDMLNTVSRMALQDPQLYTPSVISGFNNFFNQNMNNLLGKYFGKP